MSAVTDFAPGGFRYIAGVFQYSAGVAAQAGFQIERARIARPLPLLDGFGVVEAHLKAIGRPTEAFCACELRSPRPFTEAGFDDFNRSYVQTLERWGLFSSGRNPVARTNVCPVFNPPVAPSLYAFSYTVPAAARGPTFVIAGGGEAPEGKGNYRDHIVRLGDTSPEGMEEKVRFVMDEMRRRLGLLGFSWDDAMATNSYTAHDIGRLVREQIAPSAGRHGVNWHVCYPPVVGLEFEMDTRRTAREVLL